MEIVLDAETLRLLALFERITHARVKDVIDESDRVAFVVEEKDVGKAIGKGAANLKRLREILGREVEIFGFSDDAAAFVKNLFRRYEPEEIALDERPDGTRAARVKLPMKEKGRAIGKGGRNIQLLRKLALRHHRVADLALE